MRISTGGYRRVRSARLIRINQGRKIKMKRILSFLLFIMSMSSASLADANDKDEKISLIRKIQNLGKIADRAGCEFKSSDGLVLKTDAAAASALMNVDGKDIVLKRVGSPKTEGNVIEGQLVKGSKIFEKYEGNNITMLLELIKTSECSKEEMQSRGCFMSTYDATITVTKNKIQQAVKTSGSCGD